MSESDTAGDTLPSYTWTYDNDNRATGLASTDGTTTNGYDADSQLTSVTYTSPPTGCPAEQTYAYDANGNRTESGYQTGPNNELLCDGAYHYQYDADGNEIAQWVDNNGHNESSPQPGDTDVTIYAWDYHNRLTSATTYATYSLYQSGIHTQQLQYTYDIFNRRIGETVTASGPTSATWYVYDGQNVVMTLNGQGEVTARYMVGPGQNQVLAVTTDTGYLWLLSDTKGTVRDVLTYSTTTQETTLADHVRYDGFGAIIYQNGAASNPGIGFDGEFLDPYLGSSSGTYNCLARWYNPATGRYMSRDPLGFAARDPNLYCFVFNDPANLADPTGENAVDPCPMNAAARTGYNSQTYPYNGPGYGYYLAPWHNGSDSVWWGIGKGTGWVLAAVIKWTRVQSRWQNDLGEVAKGDSCDGQVFFPYSDRDCLRCCVGLWGESR